MIDPVAGSVVGETATLSGWGGRPRSTARVLRPQSLAELQSVPGDIPLVPRGLGRSYGDAAQLSGGTVLDMTALANIVLDPGSGTVTAGGGASLEKILDVSVPHGWFLPVSPGTRHVTVGGAIAADVHGKNHHRDGSFGAHVDRVRLLTADGGEMETVPGEPAFAATVGGMGLTGIIIEATFRLLPIESAWIRVDTSRASDLPAVMERLREADRSNRYSVAWLDLVPGRRGRGVVMAGDHAVAHELPRRRRPLRRTPMREVPAPPVPGGGRVIGSSIGMFNRLWFERAPRIEVARPQGLDTFFYPLDRLSGWPRIYGSAGFLQYQFVVPEAADATLLAVAELLTRTPTPVSLAVLKRMGPAAGGPLSFPIEGWTLSADMPLGDPSLGPALDSCDRLVTEAGGRIYLAKDARTRRELIATMYPRLDEWKEMKARLDPAQRLRSDLSRRLGVTS